MAKTGYGLVRDVAASGDWSSPKLPSFLDSAHFVLAVVFGAAAAHFS